jgi:NTE family protein
MPAVIGRPLSLDILTGTSVGAINAAFLAATADLPGPQQAARLCDAWRALRIEKLISLHPRDLWRAGRLLFGADPPPPRPGQFRYGGLLDTSGLERFVIETIPWRQIRRNLLAGHLQSLALSATHVGTGHTTVFIESAGQVPTSWSRDPFVRHREAAIGPRHALASAAIPMLFPAVKIGPSFFVDGGLRQNTPMAPAIRLGADRMLVISLRHVAKGTVTPQMAHEREVAYPKPLFLLGKALNALLLDHTDYDLERMQRLNAILQAGTAAFGTAFEHMLNRELARLRGAPMRYLSAVHIRPSLDIGEMASDFVRRDRVEVRGRFARRVLARLAEGEARHESDLLSYLMFDGNYCAALIELGYQDAAAREAEIAQLFADEVAAAPSQSA